MKTFIAIVMRIQYRQRQWKDEEDDFVEKKFCSHFHPLHLDAPWFGRFVEHFLEKKLSISSFFFFISSYIISKMTCIAEEIFKRKIRKILTCIAEEMLSLSLRISCRFFVPKIFRRVVWESSLKYDLDYISTFLSSQLLNHKSSIINREGAVWKMILIDFKLVSPHHTS